MNLISQNEIVIKKSRFIAYRYEISDEIEAKMIIENLKKEHKKARHIPFAYKVSNTARKSDDKEPSGTAGMPILNILERKNVNNNLIAVVRYFGGTKLGASVLLRTYSDAAKATFKVNE